MVCPPSRPPPRPLLPYLLSTVHSPEAFKLAGRSQGRLHLIQHGGGELVRRGVATHISRSGFPVTTKTCGVSGVAIIRRGGEGGGAEGGGVGGRGTGGGTGASS
jgi:hypothetical protein